MNNLKNGNVILLIRWKENGDDIVGSTAPGVEPIGKPSRYSRAQYTRMETTQPNPVKKYNDYTSALTARIKI